MLLVYEITLLMEMYSICYVALKMYRHCLHRGRSGKIALPLKAPLHGTIRPHGACRFPCIWANRSV